LWDITREEAKKAIEEADFVVLPTGIEWLAAKTEKACKIYVHVKSLCDGLGLPVSLVVLR